MRFLIRATLASIIIWSKQKKQRFRIAFFVEKIGLPSTSLRINFSPICVETKKQRFRIAFFSGEDRARTDDLLAASQAL